MYLSIYIYTYIYIYLIIYHTILDVAPRSEKLQAEVVPGHVSISIKRKHALLPTVRAVGEKQIQHCWWIARIALTEQDWTDPMQFGTANIQGHVWNRSRNLHCRWVERCPERKQFGAGHQWEFFILYTDWLKISHLFINQPVGIWDNSGCLVLGQHQGIVPSRQIANDQQILALKQPSLESGSKSQSAPPKENGCFDKPGMQINTWSNNKHMYKRGKPHGSVWKCGTQSTGMEYMVICEQSGYISRWSSEPGGVHRFFSNIFRQTSGYPEVFGL